MNLQSPVKRPNLKAIVKNISVIFLSEQFQFIDIHISFTNNLIRFVYCDVHSAKSTPSMRSKIKHF